MRINRTCGLVALVLLCASSGFAQNSSLTSFVDDYPYENVYIERVFYLDLDQNIRELYNYGGWEVQNPTLDSGAQAVSQNSALTSFYDTFGIQHVFYVDASFNVHELYDNGRWWDNRLTAGATNAPGVRDQLALASCFDSHKIEHVFYIDPVNHLRELYNDGQWAESDLTALTKSPGVAYESGLTSFCDSAGNPNVFYTGGAENHIEWLHLLNGHWLNVDLTVATKGPEGAFANALTSFYDSFGIEHAFYFDSDRHVREAYNKNGEWFGNDLTADTASLTAIPEGGLTSFFDSFRIEHVFYIDIGNHVHELYNENGKWYGNDLTANTKAPAPAQASALTSFFDQQGEHVYYVDDVEHIIELYNNGQWSSKDLTASTAAPLSTP